MTDNNPWVVLKNRPFNTHANTDKPGITELLYKGRMVDVRLLSPKQRVAFLLHDVVGIPQSAIAAMLDLNVVTVGQMIAEAREELQTNSWIYRKKELEK